MKKTLLYALLCCAGSAAAQVPYTCNFASADDFTSQWDVVNPEGDYCKWEFYEWSNHDESDGSGCATCGSWGDNTNNDWLIMAKPLTLSAGKHHMTFYAQETRDDNPELLDVFFGTTVDSLAMAQGSTSMTRIGDFAISNSDWRLRVINFDVPADGDYYFAFHSKTEGAYMMYIDDITIDQGDYVTSPTLNIVKALLPYSNCALTDESPVGLRISNTGTGAAESFTMSYTINNGTPVTQTVTAQLAADDTQDFYFDKTADLLDIDDYAFSFSLECGGETSTAAASVSHYAPITELPVQTDFYTNTGVSDTWTILGDESWTYQTWSGYYECQKTGIDNALLSHCITLNNPFRVKISYTGGSYYGASGLYVAYGRPNTDLSTWTKVLEDYEIMGDVEKEFVVTPDDPGDYSIAIVDSSSSGFKRSCVYQVIISEVLPHDVRIETATNPLAAYTPANHLCGTASYGVTVSNRGAEDVTNLTVSLKNGDQTLASSEPIATLAKGDSATVSVAAALPAVKAGDTLSLSLVAETAESDGYLADNTLTLPTVTATDTLYATENMASFEQGTGAYGSPIAFGNVYTLAEQDTLTSISVGLTSEYWGDETDELGLAVYSIQDDGKTIGRQLLDATYVRGNEGGLQTYSFPARVLPAGKYFVEVSQLGETMLGVSYEESSDGVCYQAVDGELQTVKGAFLAIRANFANDARAFKKNVAVTAITKPAKTTALFTSSETVAATLENIGANEAKDVAVSLTVGSNDQTQTVTLLPYEKATVSFEGVDLATPGDYTLTVTATLDGDEDTSDNTKSLAITSEKEESPYTLDFEHCQDFATGHEFNPRWWTENRRTENETDEFWRFTYPHAGEVAAGFLAFNVTATTPDMTSLPEDEQTPGFFAHGGERFGAAFCVAPDWNAGVDNDLTSDTWLVSPQLQLSTNSSLELYVKTHAIESQDVELEKYRLLVSTTDDNFDSFTVLGDDRQAPLDWTKVTVDLKDYDNQKVYVALQYIGQVFKNVVMMVDDINVITDGVSGIGSTTAAGVRISAESGLLTVQSDATVESVQVLDASGKTLLHARGLHTAFYRQHLQSTPKGIYLVRVTTASGTTVKKIVLE